MKVFAILVVIAATIAALVECVQTPAPRLLPRWTWLLVIAVVPVIGPVAWYLLGRTRQRATQVSNGPDDDARFMRGLDDQAWRRRQQQRRQEPPDNATPLA